MPPREPFVLHLPPSMLESFNLPRLMADDGRWSWAQAYELLQRFELAAYEREFAKNVLRTLTRFRLYRTNQRRRCGDFVAVNMSPPRPQHRTAVVIELKLGEALTENRGAASPQLANHREAVAEIAADGTLDPAGGIVVVRGDPAAVLAFLGG